jgi:hypothetical protein
MHQMHITATTTRCHNTSSGGTNPTVTMIARKDGCGRIQDRWFVLLMFDCVRPVWFETKDRLNPVEHTSMM